jgi:hypothetical protein
MHRPGDRSQKRAVAFAAILGFFPDAGTDAGNSWGPQASVMPYPHRAIASLLKHDVFGKPMRALLPVMI